MGTEAPLQELDVPQERWFDSWVADRRLREGVPNFVGGEWASSSSTTTLAVVDPASEDVIARIPVTTAAGVDRAVKAAATALAEWSSTDLEERISAVLRIADAVDMHVWELATCENREMGKPIEVAQSFVRSGANALRRAVEVARRYPFEQILDSPAGATSVIRAPVGPVALIVPWNFTVTAVLSALGPLLLAGNTVVLKPSEKSPLAAYRLTELIDLPDGVFNVIFGAGQTGADLVSHEGVKFAHFTGSVGAGRSVAQAAAGKLHRVVLELGGNDAVVIDEDVDPIEAASAVATGAFLNSGQICTSMERVYVHASFAEAFISELVRIARAISDSDRRSGPLPSLGPLVDAQQRQIVHEHVLDAVARGASLLAGGRVPQGVGFFYPATVLADVTPEMLVMRSETFGPVAPVTVVEDFAQALRLASEGEYGLAATVYSNNERNVEASRALPAGIIYVNEWQGGGPGKIYEPARSSGMGTTGGSASFDAATRAIAFCRGSTDRDGRPGILTSRR